MKIDLALVATNQMKMLVNASKKFALMVVKCEDVQVDEQVQQSRPLPDHGMSRMNVSPRPCKSVEKDFGDEQLQQIVQEQHEKGREIGKAGHEKQVCLQGKKLKFVYARLGISEKKCRHFCCLSLSPLNIVAYVKSFKWYEPPLVMDKETNMQMLGKAGRMEIGKVGKLYPHLPVG